MTMVFAPDFLLAGAGTCRLIAGTEGVVWVLLSTPLALTLSPADDSPVFGTEKAGILGHPILSSSLKEAKSSSALSMPVCILRWTFRVPAAKSLISLIIAPRPSKALSPCSESTGGSRALPNTGTKVAKSPSLSSSEQAC